jgi:PEP-CTERM motif
MKKWLFAVPAVFLFSLGQSTFGATIVEGFEGLTPGPNSPTPSWAPGSDYLAIGALQPFTFSSGVTYSGPVPNNEASSALSGALVVDFSVNNSNGPFGLDGNGNINSASQLPGGTAFLAWDNFASAGSITFTFSTPQDTVGAYVDAADGNIVETAYDAQGNVLNTTSVPAGDVSVWQENYQSITAPAITSVTFNGDFAVIDNLTFENSAASSSPEPGTLSLAGVALAGLGWGLRKRVG